MFYKNINEILYDLRFQEIHFLFPQKLDHFLLTIPNFFKR